MTDFEVVQLGAQGSTLCRGLFGSSALSSAFSDKRFYALFELAIPCAMEFNVLLKKNCSFTA